MAEWPRVKVKSICSLIVDCVNRTAPVVDGPTPYRMIRTTNVRDGRIDLSSSRCVDENTYKRWTRRAHVCDGDVILTREAPIGEVGFVRRLGPVFLGQRLMQYRADPTKADPRYLFYAFRSPYLQHQFGTHDGSGSVVSHIRVADCHEFLVPLPPRGEQTAIAELLGALDDKIELNRRMNETLEAMARAIFRDWFVDFGPTRAKQEAGSAGGTTGNANNTAGSAGGTTGTGNDAGREPYLAPEIWSLFPDRLDDEGKPEGWRHGRASDIIEFNPSEALKKGVIAPYLDMAALPTTGSVAEPPIAREFGSGMKFRNGDTLFARITPCLENGKAALVQHLPDDAVGWGSTEFIVMRARKPVPFAIGYILARDGNFRTYAIQSMTGTSGRQRAQSTVLEKYPIVLPADHQLWAKLDGLVAPLFQRVATNADESFTLAETRDLLLPKLMSGEIRVRDAEKIVEDAA